MEKIKEKTPDIILSDIVMPVMDGMSLAQTLQKDFSSSQIIMMSGYIPDSDTTKLTQIGISTLLSKPFTIPTLAQAVRSSIQKTQAEKQSSSKPTHP